MEMDQVKPYSLDKKWRRSAILRRRLAQDEGDPNAFRRRSRILLAQEEGCGADPEGYAFQENLPVARASDPPSPTGEASDAGLASPEGCREPSASSSLGVAPSLTRSLLGLESSPSHSRGLRRAVRKSLAFGRILRRKGKVFRFDSPSDQEGQVRSEAAIRSARRRLSLDEGQVLSLKEKLEGELAFTLYCRRREEFMKSPSASS